MRKTNLLKLFMAGALTLTMLEGCGSSATSEAVKETSAVETESATVESTEAETTEAATEAETTEVAEDESTQAQQLLEDLTGSYQELWPVILADEYQQTWLDNCKTLVGEENAEAAYEKLASMVSGTIYGEEAVKAYADGNGVYDCSFTEGISKLEFDGDTSTIKGYDADGKEVVHTVEAALLLLHLLPNGMDALRTPFHVVFKPFRIKHLAYRIGKTLNVGIARTLCSIEVFLNHIVSVVLKIFKAQIFKFALQFVKSQFVGQRRVKIGSFGGSLSPLFVALRIANAAHQIHGVGYKHKHHAHIAGLGNKQVSEIIGAHGFGLHLNGFYTKEPTHGIARFFTEEFVYSLAFVFVTHQ